MTPRERACLALERIAMQSGVTVAQIMSDCRDKPIVQARWQVMKALHEAGWEATRIGRFLNRNHTTVLHGLRRFSPSSPPQKGVSRFTSKINGGI